ncbi:tyrosine-type recombinase/integrase [Roseococcus sp. DSY-14]|uniref:tyrosine-type recombinase/integrase n=1 Tax=Roseococcus sp. DSY-14 TaxID=3369650 RepID=UPI00387B46E0
MPRHTKPLTAIQVARHPPGTYFDGNGLTLVVGAKGASWILRYQSGGRRRELGIGPARGADAVTLSQAREAAARHRAALRDGRDPLAEREGERQRAQEARTRTVRAVAEACREAQFERWTSARHRAEWLSSLERHVLGSLGNLPVANVTTENVVKALNPVWSRSPETASRVRGRLEQVFAYARTMGWRPAEIANPAQWRGHLENVLAAPSTLKARKRQRQGRGSHYPSLPYAQVPAFIRALAGRRGMAALALQFQIFTAARSGEVRGATWKEIDLERALWTVPAERMKGRATHAVTLSAAALAILDHVAPLAQTGSGEVQRDLLVFPGYRAGRPLSDMSITELVRGMSLDGLQNGEQPRWRDPHGTCVVPHGFRSSFKEWARYHDFRDELSELALAHRDANGVRAAYARDTLLEPRRPMMEAWGVFCLASPVTELEQKVLQAVLLTSPHRVVQAEP